MLRFVVLLLLWPLQCVDALGEELLYQCDFDRSTPTHHCFQEQILILPAWFIIDENPPSAPLSDVTAICNETSLRKYPRRLFFLQLDRRTIHRSANYRSNGKIALGIRSFASGNFVQRDKTMEANARRVNSACYSCLTIPN